MKKNCKISERELKKLYLYRKFSIKQISKKLGVSYWYIWKSMKNFKIKARSLSEANTLNNLKRKIIIQKEKLKKLYLNKRLSSIQIAKEYNCHHSVILNRLKEHNIKRRGAVESNTKYSKRDFDGTDQDKSYLLGFALGDLNVVKPNKNGKTIVIQGNSTIPEQIDLIRTLFNNYGSVKIRDIKTGFIQEKRITINLNYSFKFLLYKKDEIPKWILLNKNNFLAFLAGYMDAEAHIRTKLPTFMVINSYDKNILKQIKESCTRYLDICPKLRVHAKKGYFTPSKPKPYKKDVWKIGIYSKKDLLKLFSEIKQYLKHKNKINAMLKSIDQINYRNKKYRNKRM